MITNLPNMLTGAAVKVIGGVDDHRTQNGAQQGDAAERDAVGSINQQHGPTGQVSPATS